MVTRGAASVHRTAVGMEATMATLLLIVSKMDVGVWRIQATTVVLARLAILLLRRANGRDRAHAVAV